MKSRHRIYEDRDFWSRLEFALTGWFSSLDDKSFRHYWIDGFIPDGITDTQYGVDIEGVAWVGTGGRDQSAYRFVASIPQSLLSRLNSQFEFDEVAIGPSARELQLTIRRKTTNAVQ